MPFVNVAKPEEEFDFLRRAEESWKELKSAQYGMYLRGTNEFVGVCSMFGLSKGRESAEIGYWLDPKYANKGFMTEAVNAVANAFFEMGCARIQIVANVKNIASCKIAEKCGFEHEGIMKRYCFNPYLNEVENMALYAKINEK
jgi:RimJ/RimL family protein N-acetyltransferase